VSAKHAAAWLTVIPNKGLRLAFTPPEFVVLVRWWLGLDVYRHDHQCPLCHNACDAHGYHALTCRWGGHIGVRHDAVRDVVFHAAQAAALRVGKEVKDIITGLRERPADILFRTSPPEAVDFAITHCQQPSVVEQAARETGYAAATYATAVKDRKYKTRVENEGFIFTPAVCDVFGCWDSRGESLIKRVARNVADTTGATLADTERQLFQKVSVTLMRGNASALLARLDPTEPCLFDDPIGPHSHEPEPRDDAPDPQPPPLPPEAQVVEDEATDDGTDDDTNDDDDDEDHNEDDDEYDATTHAASAEAVSDLNILFRTPLADVAAAGEDTTASPVEKQTTPPTMDAVPVSHSPPQHQ
jgi:hypothetical protein